MDLGRKHKDAIRKSMAAYLSRFDDLTFGFATVKHDAFATVLEANGAFYQAIGHTPGEFLANHSNRLMSILIDDVYDVVARAKVPQGQDYDFQWNLRLKRADGSIGWMYDVLHYDCAENLFFVAVIDISDKMVASIDHLSYEAFQVRNEILAYVSMYTTEHIVVTDIDTDEVVYMNPAAMDLLGFQHESDWRGQNYLEIGFGCTANVHPQYLEPLTENFSVREYFNEFHNIYLHAENKCIAIPALNRQMRLNILSDITVQKQLEERVLLQKTLQKCMESLFAAGATNQKAEDAYAYILKQLKRYYHADGAFFYKFKEGTHEVEEIYKVLADGVKSANFSLPMTMSDEQIRMMEAISAVNPSHTLNVVDSFPASYSDSLMRLHAEYGIDNFSCVAINNRDDQIVAFMGVSNPQANDDTKELMELLSRFLFMFMEHEQDKKVKEEALQLEGLSKADVVETCLKNFQDLAHPQENITGALDALCRHYDGDFAVIVMNQEKQDYELTYTGGAAIPDLEGLEDQPRHMIQQWVKTVEQHAEFAADADFIDSDSLAIKDVLQEKFGIYNFIVSSIKDADGAVIGMLFVNNFKLLNRSHLLVHVVANDISDYLAKIRLFETAQLEPLTRLNNKIATQDLISKFLDKEETGTLFIVDIDNFKGLNDTLGHQVGDTAIVDIADLLRQLFRGTDVIGRIGGDEFMVFSPGLTKRDLIERKANQMLERCCLTYEKDGITAAISVSVGVCTVEECCKTFHSLYLKADHALYTSKQKGKNRYYIYEPT